MPLHNGGIAFGGGSGGGGGFPPNDLTTFTSESTESGVKLNFSGPEPTYIPDSDGAAVFAAAPRGVMIRYSTDGYPLTEKDGVLGYDFNPEGEDWNGTETNTCTVVGLTNNTKYYFTAFPYSDYGVFNRSESTKNRTEMTWVGNKGTISVNVQTPAGYTGTLGEYTITLVDQAIESPQNIEQTFTGPGVKQIGNLEGGKTYKVRLSTTTDLQAPPDSEAISVIGGHNHDVTMTYVHRYGTITVNVSTSPAGMPVGRYTVTLTPQGGGEAKTAQGTNTQAVTFQNCENGVTYTVALSAVNSYTANPNGSATAVGGQNVQHNARYSFAKTLSTMTWSEIHTYLSGGYASKLFSVGQSTGSFRMRQTSVLSEDGEYKEPSLADEIQTTAKLVHIFSDGSCAFMTQEVCVQPHRDSGYNVGNKFDYDDMQFISNNYSTILPEVANYLVQGECKYRTYGNGNSNDDDMKTWAGKIIFPTITLLNSQTYRGSYIGYDYFSTASHRSIGETYKVLDTYYSWSDESSVDFHYYVNTSGSVRSTGYGSAYGGDPEAGVPIIFVVK